MNARAPRLLEVEPLTHSAFAPFGEVIEPSAATSQVAINAGTAERYHALARIDCAAANGEAVVSWCRAAPRMLPIAIEMLERHPLGTQAFVPLDPLVRFVVVVAADPESAPRAFLARRGQGVNYRRSTWHHPLLALDRSSDFLVIDRDGSGENCDEARLTLPWRIEQLPPE